jgi:hypothetical protein
MKTISAREAKHSYGLMIDTARAEPAFIEKHGRGVIMASRWRKTSGSRFSWTP